MPAVPKTVVMFPYLAIRQPLSFSEFEVWPYDQAESRWGEAFQHVREHICCYRTANGQPLRGISPVSCGGQQLFPGRDVPFERLSVARDILFFSCFNNIHRNNFCTSDNFTLAFQSFTPGSDMISTSSGFLHSLTDTWPISEITIPAPGHINLHYNFDVDGNLLGSLAALDGLGYSAATRIIRALRPFFHSQSNSPDLDVTSRVLLMAQGFEILFDLGGDARQDFRYAVDVWCGRASDPRVPYDILHTMKNRVITTENLSAGQIWAEEFYKLRNRIIHGDEVQKQDYIHLNKHHLLHAAEFFKVGLKNMLATHGRAKYEYKGRIELSLKGTLEENDQTLVWRAYRQYMEDDRNPEF